MTIIKNNHASRPKWIIFSLIPIFLLVLTLSVLAEVNGGNWALPDRDYRMAISVDANGTARTDKIAELDIDFSARLTNDGALGSFDEASLRVVEVDGGSVALDTAVPFQFDNGAVADTADGTLIFLLSGTTLSYTTRTYHVYYDTTGTFTQPAPFTDRVDKQSDQTYRGQSSFVIISRDADGTADSTYYYHKEGAGFASILDRDNNDWISYYPENYSHSAGEYRGIPNLGYVFHPGYSDSSGSDQGSDTAVLEDGSLKLTIHAQSYDDSVEAIWEIYPTYAQMTVLDYPNDDEYWMLYEGTPGGNLDYSGANKDTMITSDNTQVDADDEINMELSPEWVYFADGTINRGLYLIHSNDDAQPESYRYQDDGAPATGSIDNGGMTVFGYGRHTDTGVDRYLTATDIQLTIGFTEDRAFNAASSTINNVSQPLLITIEASAPTVDNNNGLQLDEGTTAVISNTQLSASDPDMDPLTYTIKITPAHGTLSRNATPLLVDNTFTQSDIDSGLLSYTHDNSENFSDSFAFTVKDDTYTTAQTSFTITITNIVDPPIGTAPTLDTNNGLQLNEGTTAVISNTQLLASDLDNDPLTYTVQITPSHGILSRNASTLLTNGTFTQNDIDAGLISYTHDGSENFSDFFAFIVADGTYTTAQSSFAITITNIVDPPFGTAPTLDNNNGLQPNEGTTAVISNTQLLASDVDGDTITYTLKTTATYGTLSRNASPLLNEAIFTQDDIDAGLISYAHDGSENHADSFTFTIADGVYSSTIATFAITITAVNDPPTAISDTATSLAGYPMIIDLLSNDSDPDSGNLSITALTHPTHGTVSDNGNGTVTYTANNNYSGPDSFSYRAYDGESSSAETAVTITPPEHIFLPMIIK